MIQDQIMEKNRRFWLTKFIFNRQYIGQIQEIFYQFQHSPQLLNKQARLGSLQLMIIHQSKERDELEVLKFLVSFVLTVALRSQTRSTIPQFI